MTLRIYNTLTRAKEEFKPLDPKNVRMYVCGPTVYDFAHIGNARPAIVFDVMFRLLRHLYGPEHVTYVRNITDVDDKINARALRDYPGVPLNEAIRKVTETTYDQYQKDVMALGCLPPTHQPRATEHIKGMTDMISMLIKRGHAYEANGEVLFDVGSMPDYGRLSGRKLEEQQAGARVAVEAHKKNPADFVLWKLSSPEEPGWDSPWGRGRPGWHVECSVMSKSHLGEVFDIHGGGLDLIFPHHENEIAQSRCAHGTPVMANYWMHNGFLQVEGQKMSKSLGNFTTIADVLKDWPGEVARFNMLRTHYRQPIDWTRDSLETSENVLRAWQESIEGVEASEPDDLFVKVLTDDLNTHGAFTRLHEINTRREISRFKASLELMGFGLTAQYGRGSKVSVEKIMVEELVTARLEARKAKNWAESDRIRDELLAMGIQIKDVKDPATGELKTEWEVRR
jgi:cysteinyl-tRNA synthetase